MEVKRYENDELHIVLKNPYCDHKSKNKDHVITVDMNGKRYNFVLKDDALIIFSLSHKRKTPDSDLVDSRQSSFRKATYAGGSTTPPKWEKFNYHTNTLIISIYK